MALDCVILFIVNYPILNLDQKQFPSLLKEIPDPPKQLYLRGELPPADYKLLAVVGSRRYTSYGKQVVTKLISGLRGYPIAIISGLALGMDALAHEAALDSALPTVAIPGSGIDDSVIGPRTNFGLAQKILAGGGGLLSEFEPDFQATKWSFPQRNRIMAGMSHATLLIEAAPKSGTLITARLAVDYNRELLVVPGNIFSENSQGTHQFLKLGATPVTEANDILLALGIEPAETLKQNRPELSANEEQVLTLLKEPMEKDALIRQLNLPTAEASILLMQMEMQGYIAYETPIYVALI